MHGANILLQQTKRFSHFILYSIYSFCKSNYFNSNFNIHYKCLVMVYEHFNRPTYHNKSTLVSNRIKCVYSPNVWLNNGFINLFGINSTYFDVNYWECLRNVTQYFNTTNIWIVYNSSKCVEPTTVICYVKRISYLRLTLSKKKKKNNTIVFNKSSVFGF